MDGDLLEKEMVAALLVKGGNVIDLLEGF